MTRSIVAIAACTLAMLAAVVTLKRGNGDAMTGPAHAGPVAAMSTAGTDPVPAAIERQAALSQTASAVEILPESDTTGLLQESLSVSDLLDAVNADHGIGFSPVEPQQFRQIVQSDPALRRAFGE
ncbi:MAG: hypothetical protein ACREVI_08735 [Steroidobacteraceae bacterium]